MATNGNNGPKMTYTSQPDIGKGIGGQLQSRAAKTQFSQDFWKEKGYLDTAINELEQQQKLYNEMSKISDQMNKRDQKAIKDKLLAYKQQLTILRTIKKEQEISDLEALDLMKTSNKLLEKGQQKYIELLRDEGNILEDNAKLREDSIEKAIRKQKDLNREAKNQDITIKKISKVLNQSTDNWATSISKSINSAGDKLKELSNMFNLQSIANNMLEQNARSKAAIMSDVSKQFGFTSNSQFESFKNSLNNTLIDMNRDMGAIFNSSDMKDYMANLSTYGVTNTRMAQEQMRASIIGNKYLGVSVETQTAIFKYMKLTNNNDTLNNYNKTIVGLLKSDLGVSKEQLDQLTQMATSDQDSLLASGMSNEAYERYMNEFTTVGAVLESMYGEATAKAIMNSVQDLAKSSYNDADRLVSNYGVGSIPAMQNVKQTGDVLGTVQMLMGSSAGWGQWSSDNTANATIQDMLGATNQGALVGYNKLQRDWDKFSGTTTDILSGLKDISDLNVQSFVKETTQTTALEKIQNWLDTFLNGIPWKWTMSLANAALIAYLAAKPFELYGYFKNLKLGSLLTKSLGDGSAISSGMGSIVGGGILVNLAAASIAGIAAAAIHAGKTGATEQSTMDYIMTPEERSEQGWAASLWHDIKGGAAVLGGLVGKGFSVMGGSKPEFAKNSWRTIMGAIGLSEDPDNARFGRLAALMLFDKAGSLEYLRSEGVQETHDDLVRMYNNLSEYEKADVESQARYIGDSPFYYVPTADGKSIVNANDIDWANYHKNGLSWVPRDNYKALLHKGEMVLNSKEADFYRQMFPQGGESDKTPRQDGRIITGLPWTMTAGYPSYPSGNQHRGVDFGISVGTPVGAAMSGEVVAADDRVNYNTYASGVRSFGEYVLVKGDNGLYYRYGHLSKLGVTAGQRVNTGDTIGLSGNTGYSTGPHVHFQVQTGTANNTDISPYNYITSGLFQAKGDINIPGSTIGRPTTASEDGTIKLRTRRFIPTVFQPNTGGMGGADMNKAVDNGINKIINYLDGVREEQAEQRKIINAFAKSRSTELAL